MIMDQLQETTRSAIQPKISIVVLTAILVLGLLPLVACEEKLKPSIATNLASDLPSQESWDAKIVFTDSGKLSGILRAGHIASYAEKKLTYLDGNITVDFFNERQEHTSVLTAQRGTVNDVTHDFEARENVVVVSDSGTTLRTEVLYWTNTTRKVHTPAFVSIKSLKEQLQGHGLESDQGLKHYTILKVTGEAESNE